MPRVRANRRVEVPQWPWDRQAGESEPAYAAFLLYRDLVDDQQVQRRSLSLVAQRTGRSSTKTIWRWSVDWEWPARALAWDNWRRQQADRERRRNQADTIGRHQLQATALLGVAIRLIQPPPRLPEEARRDWVPRAIDVQAAANALEKAQKMQRLALGLPTEHTRQDVTMRQAMTEALEGQKLLAAVVQEHLCDECRARIAEEWERVKRHHRAMEEQLS